MSASSSSNYKGLVHHIHTRSAADSILICEQASKRTKSTCSEKNEGIAMCHLATGKYLLILWCL